MKSYEIELLPISFETAVERIVDSRKKKPISKPARNREELDVSRVEVDHKDGERDDPPVGT